MLVHAYIHSLLGIIFIWMSKYFGTYWQMMRTTKNLVFSNQLTRRNDTKMFLYCAPSWNGYELYPSLRFSLLSALSSSLPTYIHVFIFNQDQFHYMTMTYTMTMTIWTNDTNWIDWEWQMEPKFLEYLSKHCWQKLLSGTTFTWTSKPCGTYFQIQYILK